jgi:hypothetical protein
MTEYAAYLDDSGHPDDSPFVVAAGFLASAAQWDAFGREWINALAELQIGEVLHMAEFHGSRSKKEEGQALERLTSIINTHTEAAFSCTIDMSDYRRLNDKFPLEEAIGTPFAIACRTVAAKINLWRKRFFKPGDGLSVYVEAGTKHIGDMEQAFERDELPKPSRVTKNHPAAQAADLFAWESFRHGTHGEQRRSLRNLLMNKNLYEGIMREKNLMHSLSATKAPPREVLPDNVEFSFHSAPKRPRTRRIH